MRLLKIASVLISFLFLYAGTVFGFTTNNTSSTRTFNKNESARGQSIAVTVTFTNNEASSLRGFYYAEQIPEGLVVSTTSVKINGNTVSNYIFESGSVGDAYPGNVVYRWILETPTSFSENHPIPSGSNVQIVYSLSSIQPRAFHLDEFNWVGYYQGGSKAAFGHSENDDKKSIRIFKVDVDFDKDGKTDIAFYRSSTGVWWIIPSSGIPAYGVGWGGPAFKPVPGDYDGDGKTDIGIYDTTGGAWWIIPSSGIPAYGVGWGGPAFKPVPGDYDGDGKTDIAIYDTIGGAWWIIPSSGVGPQGQVGAYGVGWGGPGFKPVPGDYGGDRKTDVAIYQTSNGGWWIVYSSDGSNYGMGWGGDPNDIPVTENPASIY